jgi:hypothetical protein
MLIGEGLAVASTRFDQIYDENRRLDLSDRKIFLPIKLGARPPI